MGIDYSLILRNALTLFWKDQKTLFYMGVHIAFSILSLIAFTSLGMYFLGDNIFQFINALGQLESDSSIFLDLFESVIVGNIVPFILAAIVVGIICVLISHFIDLLIYSRAMEVVGLESEGISIPKYAKIILLYIWVIIATFTSLYHKTFLYYFIGLIIFSIIVAVAFVLNPILGLIALFIWALLFFIYCLIIIYNSIRLSLSTFIMLQKDGPVMQTANSSWDLTEKRAFEVFIGYVLVSAVIIAIGFALSILTILLRLGLTIGSSNFIIAFAADILISIITAPLYVAIFGFGYSTLYSQILPKNAAAQKPQAPVPRSGKFSSKKTK